MKKELWVRVCPNCGSRDVIDRGAISSDAYSRNNFCRSCGFQSPLFPEIKAKDALRIKSKLRNFNNSYSPIFAETYGESKSSQKMVSILTLLFLLLVVLYVLSR